MRLKLLALAAALVVAVSGGAPIDPTTASADVVIVSSAPPVPRHESVPKRPGPGYVWIGGHWTYEGLWVWRHGYWARPPRGKSAWVPGRWEPRSKGWVWIEGYWR